MANGFKELAKELRNTKRELEIFEQIEIWHNTARSTRLAVLQKMSIDEG